MAPRGRLQTYAPWIAAAAAAIAGAAVLQIAGSTHVERFFGPVPPALAVAVTGAVGLGALRTLEVRGFWRRACFSRTARGLAVATLATLPFAAVAIAVDVVIGFPEDTNVSWPAAWVFYPTIAVAAEVVFHLVPLAALSWFSGWRFHGRAIGRQAAALILATATLEPISQVLLRSALPAFVMPHVFIFGVVQLVLLRRYGYVPMLWFRVCYYLLWHVLWGAVRLRLLF